jgi:hypothetical protein
MLVIRAWLASYARRYGRLRHLIALAPGTFGSPLAHKGRSWLGAIFKGNRQFGPDFMEAGDLILDGLELGSRFTWDLAHLDLIGKNVRFGPEADTPYVFTFCGNKGYGGLRSVVNEPGTDGTVRWAGCPLNSRKIIIDLTDSASRQRIRMEKWSGQNIPLIPADGLNHETIISSPSPDLVQQVVDALQVTDRSSFDRWLTRAQAQTQAAREAMTPWQQFIVRAMDERGDPITDYNLQLFTSVTENRQRTLAPFYTDVHVYSRDASLRCFHVRLDRLKPEQIADLYLYLLASSGSERVGYYGYGVGAEKTPAGGKWDAALNISELLTAEGARFFYPFTTTLLEVRLNREPLPLQGPNQVLWFMGNRP